LTRRVIVTPLRILPQCPEEEITNRLIR